MLYSKKLLCLFAALTISQQYQAKHDDESRFDHWRQKHAERKAISERAEAQEASEDAKIARKNISREQKHKERKAAHARSKAKEEKEKAALEEKYDNKAKKEHKKRKAAHAEEKAERETRKARSK